MKPLSWFLLSSALGDTSFGSNQVLNMYLLYMEVLLLFLNCEAKLDLEVNRKLTFLLLLSKQNLVYFI